MNNKNLILKKQTLVDIADQIRAKTGSADLIAIEDLDDAIKDISGGSEGTGYTLTLAKQTKSGYSNDVSGSGYAGVVQYQKNGDGVWHDFESMPLTLNNIKSIKFKASSDGKFTTLVVGFGTNSLVAQNYFFALPGQYGFEFTPEFKITADDTFYIGANSITTGGGAS